MEYEEAERLAIQDKPIPAEYKHPELKLIQGARNELEISTHKIRRFSGIGDDEFIELTAFLDGSIWVAQCSSEAEHVRLLREVEKLRGFSGAYMLVNGLLDPALSARYEQNRWVRAKNGRATDRDVRQLRSLYLDCDPVRPKGISSTDEQKAEARTVATQIREFLSGNLSPAAIGFGDSGNGYYILVALEPEPPTDTTSTKIQKLIKALGSKFGTPTVKLDASVFNPARLMPAPGTWKRKGRSTPERPHRLTSFACASTVVRIPLGELA